MVPNETHQNSAKAASTAAALELIISLWFFISPWVYGAYHSANAWNSWIVGGVMAIIAAVCLSSANVANLNWTNTVLAAWVFVSPWVYGYTMDTGRFVNSLCVGVVVFVLSIMAATMMHRTFSTTSTVPHRM